MTIFYLAIVWLSALLFSLPMILSFESNISVEGSYSCDTTWSDKTLNNFFIVKYIFMFIVPFSIILVSSSKLLIFLNNWKRKRMQNKKKRNKESKRFLFRSSCKKTVSSSMKNSNETKYVVEKSLFEVSTFKTEINQCDTQDNSTSFRIRIQATKRKVKSKMIRNKAIKIVLCIVLLFFIQWSFEIKCL